MAPEIEALIQAYLDDEITPEGLATLEAWLQEDPDHREIFAQEVLLHERLRAEWSLESWQESEAAAPANVTRFPSPWRRRWAPLAAAISGLCLLGWLTWQGGQPAAMAAEMELQRVLDSTRLVLDRTYRLTPMEGKVPRDGGTTLSRTRPQPNFEVALLHLRGPQEYVLERQMEDGSRILTGSDGKSSWMIPARGRVRVSQDPMRFRGTLPGQQHSIPFLDPRTSLQPLLDSYDLTLEDEDLNGWRRLVAERRTDASRGPGRVTLWYDPASATLQRMLLERLPLARGGPRHMLFELLETAPKDADFYQHNHHHAPDREVIQE